MASIRVVLDCYTAYEVDDHFAIDVISVRDTTAPRYVPAGLEFRGGGRRSYS